MAITAHRNTLPDYRRDSAKLGQYLGISIQNLDHLKLAEDIYHATLPEMRAHLGLNRAAQRLAADIHSALPAYRVSLPIGPRLYVLEQDEDDLEDHFPGVTDGHTLPRPVRWHDWRSYVHALAGFIAAHTGTEPGTYRVEQAAVDLHLHHPDLDLDAGTVRALSGRLGLSGLVEFLDVYATATGRHLPDDGDQEHDDDTSDYYTDNPNPDYDDLVEGIAELQQQLADTQAALTTERSTQKAPAPSIWDDPWNFKRS